MASVVASKTTPLPPYSEMIMSAIEALDEKSGSNKSSISKYIESKYAEQLSDSHSTLLAAHLARMKESGEILMVKNNYLKAGPDAPLKRGRGRPPKPKDPSSEVESSEPKPRGRPPKPKDEMEATTESRGRGRPPKKAKVDGEEGTGPTPDASVGIVKRGRGRPPKVKPPFADVGFA